MTKNFVTIQKCPLCNSKSIRNLFQAKDLLMLKEGTFNIQECQECSYRFTNPQPSPESIFDYYTSDYPCYQPYDDWDSLSKYNCKDENASRMHLYNVRLNETSYSFYGGPFGARAWAFPHLPRGAKVMELGCGTGSFIQQCVTKGWKTIGTDLNPDLDNLIASVGGKFFTTNLPSLNFPDNHFDAIFAWQVMEHLYDPVTTCQEIHRVLKPGGFFIFSVPNSNCWQFKLFKSKWAGLQVPTHLSHFCRKSIRLMLKLSNLKLKKIYGQNTIGCLIPSIQLMAGRQNVELSKPLLGSLLLSRIFDRGLGLLVTYFFGCSQSERITIISTKD